MFIVICGGGKIGFSLAKQLHEENNKVVVIERNHTVCENISKDLDIIVINGDACQPDFLEEAGTKNADAVIALTGDDEDNLIICQLAKLFFFIPRTIARVNHPSNEIIFTQLGVDIAVNSTKIIAQLIDQKVSLDDINILLKLKQGNIAIIQAKISINSNLINHSIKDLNLPKKCIIASILRNNDIIVPKGDTVLKANDELLAITIPEKEKELSQLFSDQL